MPPASETANLNHLLRTLIFGPSKARKTWWTCRAAEAGFNVILFDGDNGSEIAQQLPAKARERILIVDAVDEMDRPIFSGLMAKFLRNGSKFTWDEAEKLEKLGMRKAGHSFIEFNPQLFTANDVIVFDSWTALAQSARMQYAKENKIDLSDATKTEWDGYGFEGNFLDFVLKQLHGLPCHVVVIGHSYIYEKWDRRDKRNPKLVSQKTIPMSSSGPQGAKLAKAFSDVLYFDRLTEQATYIYAGGSSERDGGSRYLPPKNYKWEDMPLFKLLELAGSKGTNEPCKGAVWVPPQDEDYVPGKTEKPGNGAAVVAEKAPAEIKKTIGGLSSIERIKMQAAAQAKGGDV